MIRSEKQTPLESMVRTKRSQKPIRPHEEARILTGGTELCSILKLKLDGISSSTDGNY